MRHFLSISSVLALLALTACGGFTYNDPNSSTSCGPSLSASTSGAEFGIVDTRITGMALAQSFASGSSDLTVTGIKLKLLRVGSPNVTVTVSLQLDSANGTSPAQPSGTDLVSTSLSVSAGRINGNLVSTTGDFYAATFPASVTLSKAKFYWIKVSSGAWSSTDQIEWAANDSNPLSTGNSAFLMGASWKTSNANPSINFDNKDFIFNLQCGS